MKDYRYLSFPELCKKQACLIQISLLHKSNFDISKVQKQLKCKEGTLTKLTTDIRKAMSTKLNPELKLKSIFPVD